MRKAAAYYRRRRRGSGLNGLPGVNRLGRESQSLSDPSPIRISQRSLSPVPGHRESVLPRTDLEVGMAGLDGKGLYAGRVGGGSPLSVTAAGSGVGNSTVAVVLAGTETVKLEPAIFGPPMGGRCDRGSNGSRP